MKKILAILLAVLLIVSMAIPAAAVTPKLQIPDVPKIPDISDDVRLNLPDGIFDEYIPDIAAGVELPADEQQAPDNWPEWLQLWYQWWCRTVKRH